MFGAAFFAAAAMVAACSTLAAQPANLRNAPSPGFAAIAGVVDDSLRGGPLVGASVVVIGTSRRAVTDRDGFFRIDSVPPGEVQLAVLHPLLDSLFLAIASSKVTIPAGKLEDAVISTPSLERVRERACPRAGVVTGRSMIAGRVDEAERDGPVVNAVVSLVYSDPSSGTPIQRVRTARTRGDGFYAICGLPATFSGTIQAASGTVESSEISVSLREQELGTASFLLDMAARSDSGRKGAAVLRGRITDVAGTPVREAQVAVEGGTAIAVTGPDGSFTLSGLPSGTTNAVVRKIGYAPAYRTVHLRTSEPQNLGVVLAAGARTLAQVNITARPDNALKKLGFLERRNIGMRSGFMLPEDIAKRQAKLFTDLFRTLPGFRVTTSGFGQMVEGTRSSTGGTMAGCVNIFVDRVAFEQMSPGDLDAAFPINHIGALESYASASETPAEFQMAGRACATIVAWTKQKLSKP